MILCRRQSARMPSSFVGGKTSMTGHVKLSLNMPCVHSVHGSNVFQMDKGLKQTEGKIQ